MIRFSFMSGTRRQETIAVARGGTTVLTPGPWYPPAMPCTSNVGWHQIRFIASTGSLVRIDLNW